MSSINPHYTFEYSQPAEYHFSHDSVFLARRVFEGVRAQNVSELRALDLCSGCGIIGLDFIFHCQKELSKTPASFDFLEVQEVYKEHFEENVRRLGPVQTNFQFLAKNYADLATLPEHHSTYDLIVCNPPYFHPGQGSLSPSDFKNRCRFFLDSSFANLLSAIAKSLKPTGKAFLLLREQTDHGWSALEEIKQRLDLQLEILEDVRGTHVVCLQRTPVT